MHAFPGDIYGEITEKGSRKLIETFSEYFNEPEGVFYDLGSGNGDLTIFIANNTPLKKVCGIELHTTRYNTSKEKYDNLDIKQLSFLHEDFTESDLSDATVIYIDNLVIPRTIATKFYANVPKGCLVVSTKRINNWELGKKYKETPVIEKSYTKRRKNWYIVKE